MASAHQQADPGRGRVVKPTPWEFAGLLLTYWCNARCAVCYVYSGPDRGGELSAEQAVELWTGLDRHAVRHGKGMRIHLSGGEPFGDWPRLVSIIRAAREAGLTPVEKIETNAFWASDDDRARAWLELLDALGLGTLVVSTDVYHQEFVPIERVRRCVDIARKVLGGARVRVRWWDFLREPVEVRGMSATGTQAAYRTALARHKDRLTGRAAERLAGLLPRHPAGCFEGQTCVEEVLCSRHVHIDPYGNVFPGVCNGIILGNALGDGVERVWQRLADGWRKHPVVAAVAVGGSYELMQQATAFGYRELSGGYASKCHLCTHVRQFLVDHGHWPQFVGPPECYAKEADRRDDAPVKALTERD
jgi:MoaA/NifB/PqqE/SkfB family radical SAM enzyme